MYIEFVHLISLSQNADYEFDTAEESEIIGNELEIRKKTNTKRPNVFNTCAKWKGIVHKSNCFLLRNTTCIPLINSTYSQLSFSLPI